MKISEKYPGAYFEHWLVMFYVDQPKADEIAIKEQIEIYKTFEGEEKFSHLQAELNSIVKNGDLDKFIDVIKFVFEKGIPTSELINMADIILAE